MDNVMTFFEAYNKLQEYSQEIKKEVDRWLEIKEHGINDRIWEDGGSMNLVRNHIIYYKRNIQDICDQFFIDYPKEFFIETPPKVPYGWMYSMDCDRAKEFLKDDWHHPVHTEVVYEPYK